MRTFSFGPHLIRASEVFFNSRLSLGIVNLKPLVPGHVLVLPRRVAFRFSDLTHEEVADLFLSVQTIGKVIENQYGGEGLTVAIQDGPAAGQTVKHVHVHIIPRRSGDYPHNDDIYEDIQHGSLAAVNALAERDGHIAATGLHHSISKTPTIERSRPRTVEALGDTTLDRVDRQKTAEGLPGARLPKQAVDFEERPPRSLEEMAQEAGKLRQLFQQYENVWTIP
ncbi:HIT-like protein [Gonapodya prolifera JEL478]|uniref:HIT-like protein n=1 Tax=Gonapodya prolifera (strain JEL478) TaxID=1344416 RepID=A0A139AQ12_GONPJ|nr:HIT-like protein [Gonapodya prolifera JEL478]|eukprot:KXS18826.1 HIT-like protein [Gonapodya prolifera JEL478]